MQLSMTWASVWTRPQGHNLSSTGRRPLPRLFQRPLSIASECALSRSLVHDMRSISLTLTLLLYTSCTIKLGLIIL